ncbi:hypothetical protein ACS0TY_020280 [Phlomoides rotata]
MGATKVSLLCATLILVISIPNFHLSEAAGFSIDLIHRNSLQSPSLSFDHVQTSLHRSFNRAKTLVLGNSLESTPSTEIVHDGGEYLVKISLGTPKTDTYAIADTGSDLIWVQCKPCVTCFKQKSPLFDPAHSSSYKPAACDSKACDALTRSSCSAKNTCSYSVAYGDRSYSRGELATETITLGTTKIPNVVIGCGHNDQGTFGPSTTGIVGLGGGKVSLIRQLQSSIQGKFSYCLVPFLGNKNPRPSKMNFGDSAKVSGAGVVKTPIVPKSPDTFYYLTLEGITVGAERLDAAPSLDGDDYGSGSTEGNIIIDSGTTLTFLPSDLYDKVQAAVQKQVKGRRIRDPAGILDLCYLASGESESLPEITAHFKGADLRLKAENVFVKTTERSVCLAFAPASSVGVGIYGNLAQMGFLVGYDLERRTVSFKPTDCSKV